MNLFLILSQLKGNTVSLVKRFYRSLKNSKFFSLIPDKAKLIPLGKYTIVFFPPDNGPPGQVQVPAFYKRAFKLGAGIMLTFTLALVVHSFYLSHYIKESQAKIAKIDQLQAELQAKDTQIADLNAQNADAAASGLPDIEAFESQVMAILKIQRSTHPSMPSRGLDASGPSSDTMTDQNTLTLDDHLKLLEQLYNAVSQGEEELSHIPTILPLAGEITSPFGNRRNPFGGNATEFHDGVDLACNSGTSVQATADGVVTFAGWDYVYGRKVELDHGNGIITFYGHNSQLLVKAGDHVKKGDVISYSGNTGRSLGPHLHYGTHVNGQPVDPLSFAKS